MMCNSNSKRYFKLTKKRATPCLAIVGSLATVSSMIFGLVVSIIIYIALQDGELPVILDQYWGRGIANEQQESDISIRPFTINISSKVLSDFKSKVAMELAILQDRIAEPLEGVGFEYGVNKKFLINASNYLLTQYDWRERERVFNQWPSFKTKLSGLNIHFQHIKPKYEPNKKIVPLLLLHGWPFTLADYKKLIPILVDAQDSDYNIELIIPSLPGFGFSESAHRPGLGGPEMGLMFLKLMQRLGHDKFYVGGGDWGGIIAGNMATMYKDNILGLHSSMCIATHPKSTLRFVIAAMFPSFFMDEDEIKQLIPISRRILNLIRESGYLLMHATKPDTIGVALSLSPLGWMAYAIEKVSFWGLGDSYQNLEDGGINAHFNLDDVLDSIVINWFAGPTTSMRFYKESIFPGSTHEAIDKVPIQVPVSCLNFPSEPLMFPKFALLPKYPKLRFTKAPSGGHVNFAEVPDILGKDILEFINIVEKESRTV